MRMETPGGPLFDKECNELGGMGPIYAKERTKREYLISPKLVYYFLRAEQQDQPDEVNPEVPG